MKGFPFKQRFLAVAVTAIVSTSIASAAQAQSSSPTTQLRNVVEKMMNQEPVTRGDLRLVDEYSRQPSFGQYLAPIEGFNAQDFARTARLYGLNDVEQNLSYATQVTDRSLIENREGMPSENIYSVLDRLDGTATITPQEQRQLKEAFDYDRLSNQLNGPRGDHYRRMLHLYGVNTIDTPDQSPIDTTGNRLVMEHGGSISQDGVFAVLEMLDGRQPITEKDREALSYAYQYGRLDDRLSSAKGDHYRDMLKLYGVNMVATPPDTPPDSSTGNPLVLERGGSVSTDGVFAVLEMMDGRQPITEKDREALSYAYQYGRLDERLSSAKGDHYRDMLKLYGVNMVATSPDSGRSATRANLIIDSDDQSIAGDNPYDILGMMHHGRDRITERDRKTINAAYRDGKLDNYLGGPDGDKYRDTLKLYGVNMVASDAGVGGSSGGRNLIIDSDDRSIAGDNPYDILGMMHHGRDQITERDRQTINAAYQDGKLDNYLGGPDGDKYRDTLKLYGIDQGASNTMPGIVGSDENRLGLALDRMDGKRDMSREDQALIQKAYDDGRLDNYLGGPDSDRFKYLLQGYGISIDENSDTDRDDSSDENANSSRSPSLDDALDRMDGEQSISREDQALIQEAYDDGRLDNYLSGSGGDEFSYLLESYGVAINDRDQQSPTRPGVVGQSSGYTTVYSDYERSDIIVGVTTPPPPTSTDAIDLSDYQPDGRSSTRPSASEIRDRLQPPSYVRGDNTADYMASNEEMASQLGLNSNRLRGSTLHTVGRDGELLKMDDPIEGQGILNAGLSCMRKSEGLRGASSSVARLDPGDQRIIVDKPRTIVVVEYRNKGSSDGEIQIRRTYQVKSVMLDWRNAGRSVGGNSYAREIKRVTIQDKRDEDGKWYTSRRTRNEPQPWRWYGFGCRTTDVRIPESNVDLDEVNDYLADIDPTRNSNSSSDSSTGGITGVPNATFYNSLAQEVLGRDLTQAELKEIDRLVEENDYTVRELKDLIKELYGADNNVDYSLDDVIDVEAQRDDDSLYNAIGREVMGRDLNEAEIDYLAYKLSRLGRVPTVRDAMEIIRENMKSEGYGSLTKERNLNNVAEHAIGRSLADREIKQLQDLAEREGWTTDKEIRQAMFDNNYSQTLTQDLDESLSDYRSAYNSIARDYIGRSLKESEVLYLARRARDENLSDSAVMNIIRSEFGR